MTPIIVEESLDSRKQQQQQPIFLSLANNRPYDQTKRAKSSDVFSKKSKNTYGYKSKCLIKCPNCSKISFNGNFFRRHMRLKHRVILTDQEIAEYSKKGTEVNIWIINSENILSMQIDPLE